VSHSKIFITVKIAHMKEQKNVQDENIENKENIDIEQKDGQTSQDETSEDQ